MRTDRFTQIQKQQMKTLYYATFLLFLPIFAGMFFLFHKDESQQIVEEVEEVVSSAKEISLDKVFVNAHSAFVINLETKKILYDKNSNKLLPLASLTKLVTAKVANDNFASTRLSIQKDVSSQGYGDTRLLDGELWNASDLISYTLLTSSNDGAHSLLTNSASDTLSFTQQMNSFVASIGLVQTQFKNETGLDNDSTGVPNSKGTAQEVAQLLTYLVKNDLNIFEKTKYTQVNLQTPRGIETTFNTNQSTDKIVGILMSKTGYTDLAGGNLAIVADMGLNEPTAFVVLKSSRESRFDDILALQENYFEQLREGMR